MIRGVENHDGGKWLGKDSFLSSFMLCRLNASAGVGQWTQTVTPTAPGPLHVRSFRLPPFPPFPQCLFFADVCPHVGLCEQRAYHCRSKKDWARKEWERKEVRAGEFF